MWSLSTWGWKGNQTPPDESRGGGGAGGGGGGGGADVSGDAQSSTEMNPFHGMTVEEREALFSAMAGGGTEMDATYTSLLLVRSVFALLVQRYDC